MSYVKKQLNFLEKNYVFHLIIIFQVDLGDEVEIDFGALDAPAADGAIDFGDGDAAEIDWGNIDSAVHEDIVSGVLISS